MTSTNVRACQPCRTAKTKCDLGRPVCGRCTRLKNRCFGYTADSDFVFRNENTVAKRNSERARKKTQFHSVALAVRPGTSKKVQTPPQTSFIDISAQIAAAEVPYFHDEAHKVIPATISRPLVDRVVDRYFLDWIIIPSDQGKASGPLYQLPMLYMTAPEGSTMRLAMQALAYAHLQGHKDDDEPLHVKATTTYGAALQRMKTEVSDKVLLPDIRLLVSILMLDNFESLHLGRLDMLGPHSAGVNHILSNVGTAHFDNRLSFALWKIAHHRLLAKQLVQRQSPTEAQLNWTRFVNTAKPDLYLSVACVKLAVICGKVNELAHDDVDLKLEEKLIRARELSAELLDFKTETDAWLANIPEAWRPQQRDGNIKNLPPSFIPASQYGPMPVHNVIYQDMEFAAMLNFYQATSIVVHESMIELHKLEQVLSDDVDAEETEAQIASEKVAIVDLANTILSTFPTFVKAAALAGAGVPKRSAARADLAGRFFAMFSMLVFERADYVPRDAKVVARWVIESVKVDYALI